MGGRERYAHQERDHLDRSVCARGRDFTNVSIRAGARNGTELVYGDLLLHKGVLKALGYVPRRLLARFDLPESVAARYNITTHLRDAKDKEGLDIVDARGGWVTPGLGHYTYLHLLHALIIFYCSVDLHTHIGLDPAPQLAGSDSTNSPHGPISPPLRSLDGFNTHDDARALALAGGVTSGLVLPGSGNAVGISLSENLALPTSDVHSSTDRGPSLRRQVPQDARAEPLHDGPRASSRAPCQRQCGCRETTLAVPEVRILSYSCPE